MLSCRRPRRSTPRDAPCGSSRTHNHKVVHSPPRVLDARAGDQRRIHRGDQVGARTLDQPRANEREQYPKVGWVAPIDPKRSQENLPGAEKGAYRARLGQDVVRRDGIGDGQVRVRFVFHDLTFPWFGFRRQLFFRVCFRSFSAPSAAVSKNVFRT